MVPIQSDPNSADHDSPSTDRRNMLWECLAVASAISEDNVLMSCDPSSTQTLRALTADAVRDPQSVSVEGIDAVIDLAYRNMSTHAGTAHSLPWRRFYTEASLLKSLCLALQTQRHPPLEDLIEPLDKAIILAGAPGDGRLEFITNIIAVIQSSRIPAAPPEEPAIELPKVPEAPVSLSSCSGTVLRFEEPPSLASFRSIHSQRPFVLPGFILDWPALNEHPWASSSYLRSVVGPGRTVPVEVGSDYRTDDWTQTLMRWDDFLDALKTTEPSEKRSPLYLAQHNLMMQFPRLRDDVTIPDYVYACPPPPPDYPTYRPPTNDEELVMNVWLGPGGTVSPAHTDPYFNFYAQVVGRKTVWLAPPSATPSMFAYSATPEGPDGRRNLAASKSEPSLSNTSRVNVFAVGEEATKSRQEHELFWTDVPPQAMSVTLDPGDLLFFPPGWWHAMRSEETSFSVSMWF